MNKKELVEFLIKNFTDEKGNLDLINLDFSNFEGNIYLSEMRVKEHLYQNYQEVQGNLYQDCQEVQGDLFQDRKEIKK